MQFRKLIRILHRIIGLASGAVLLIVATTGCLLTFEDEIRSATQHELIYVEPANRPQLTVQQLLAAVKAYDPKIKVTQLRYYGEASKAVQCYAKDRKIYAVDPYTGAVAGARDQDKDFMTGVLTLHRTLFLGHVGEEIIFWNVFLFALMLVSGLILWAPKRIKYWRQVVTIKRGASAKRRNYDLHSVAGFYAFLPLFLIAITGIDMASGKAKTPPQKSILMPGSAAVSGVYDKALRQVYHQEPIELLRIGLPKDSTDAISISIRYKTSSFRKQTNFLFDRYTAKLLSTEPWQDKDLKQRFFGSDYEIHTGRIWGLPGKIIMFLAAIVAISLPITGFLIWKGKQNKKKIRMVALPS